MLRELSLTDVPHAFSIDDTPASIDDVKDLIDLYATKQIFSEIGQVKTFVIKLNLKLSLAHHEFAPCYINSG